MVIGGIEQWVSISGEDRDNPVILVLHGGPGVSIMPFAAAFAPLRSSFTVVQWDQRGAGKTFGRYGAERSGELTADRIVADGIELSEHLLEGLGKRRIALLAVSFGTRIGLAMVQARPELFAAYVGTGQIADGARGDAVGYSRTLERARATGNHEALAELEAIGSPPWSQLESWGVAKRWALRLTREDDPAREIDLLALLRAAPGYSDADMENLLNGQAFSAAALAPHLPFDARRLGMRFSVPVFIFQGRHDLSTPLEPVASWFEAIDAPVKALLVVEDASHPAFFTHRDRLVRWLTEQVRPWVVRAR